MTWVKQENQCDECRTPLAKDAGGLCDFCIVRLHDEQCQEWWD